MKALASIAAIFSLLITACTGGSDSKKQYRLYFNHPLHLKAGTQLTSSEQAIFNNIQSGKPLNYNRITDSFVEAHLINYKQFSSTTFDKKDLSDFISYTRDSVKSNNPHEIKLSYEKAIEVKITPQALDRNKDAISIPHIVNDSALQCYSGTSLFEVVYRGSQNVKSFIEANRVVIYEPGHILPGYMLATKDGYRLYGVETTVAGKGIADYGPTDKIQEAVRIIDANDFLVIEVLKRHLDPLKNNLLTSSALKSAAIRYNINLDITESKLKSGTAETSARSWKTSSLSDSSQKTNASTLNSSIFSFGKSLARTGRRTRDYKDIVGARGDHAFLHPSGDTTSQVNSSPPLECGQDINNTPYSEEYCEIIHPNVSPAEFQQYEVSHIETSKYDDFLSFVLLLNSDSLNSFYYTNSVDDNFRTNNVNPNDINTSLLDLDGNLIELTINTDNINKVLGILNGVFAWENPLSENSKSKLSIEKKPAALRDLDLNSIKIHKKSSWSFAVVDLSEGYVFDSIYKQKPDRYNVKVYFRYNNLTSWQKLDPKTKQLLEEDLQAWINENMTRNANSIVDKS